RSGKTGRGGRRHPPALHPARHRHRPRPQRHLRLLPGADRKELTMASLARLDTGNRSAPVNDRHTITSDEAWAAFERRDRSWDGQLVGGVKTTGIYCRPSCPARRPKRDNVEFFPDGAAARAAGYRACLRCEPDDVNREEIALEKAFALLAAAEEAPSLEYLATGVGYSPPHFHPLFKRAPGVPPAAYYRSLRARRAETALSENAPTT